MARITVASLAARMDAVEEVQHNNSQALARIEALLTDGSKAKTTTRKTTTRKAKVTKAPTKGSQTRETLSRKDWNKTLTTKARLAGGDAYKVTIANWADVQEARNAGMTPDEALALILG